MSGGDADSGGQSAMEGLMDALGFTNPNPGPGTGGPSASSPAGGAQAASGAAPGTGTPDPGQPGNDSGVGGLKLLATPNTTTSKSAEPKPVSSGLSEAEKLEERRRRAPSSSTDTTATKVLLGA